MTDTATWYITFGFGQPFSGHYSEILVPADLTPEEQREAARAVAFASYGRAWAFEYAPGDFDRCIGRFGMKLRETITSEVSA